MKTQQMSILEKVIHDNPEMKKLITGVIDSLGGWNDEMQGKLADIRNHGIGGGFTGFCYYTETVAFFRKYRTDIMNLATRQAEDLNMGYLEMIQGFNCFRTQTDNKPDYTIEEIAEAIFTRKGDKSDYILNGMAWYAGEEVSRLFEVYE